MKLGTETGSLVNHMLADFALGEVRMGDGATVCGWTDRKAATVIHATPSTITVQMDRSTRIDSNGMSDCQDYSYEPDINGSVITFRKNKKGQWKSKGGSYLSLGRRSTYHDFSF